MTEWLNRATEIAPLGVWIAALLSAAVLAIAFVRLIRRRRGLFNVEDRAARLLLAGALAGAAVVVVGFMVGTLEGSIAFARDMLGWTDWRRYLPWSALDAASISFSLFAIRAVELARPPRTARRVVYITASFSAFVQMTEGGNKHKWQAGLFLAFLALLSALVLHTVIEQLRNKETAEVEDLRSPRFGRRWLTSPTSTLCAWLAWSNFPPAEDLRATVANALIHLDTVRLAKAAKRSPLGRRLHPWRHVRLAAAESVRLTEQVREQTAELNALRQRTEAAEQAARDARTEAEQSARTEREQASTTTRVQTTSRATRPINARPEQRPDRSTPQAAGMLVTDEQLVEKLFGLFVRRAEQTGSLPGRYWVEQNGPCHMRQANRVLSALTNRWAEQNPTPTGQTGPGGGEQTDDDSEFDPVAVNG